MAELIFKIIIAVIVVDFIVGQYLSFLNSKRQSETLPLGAEEIYDAEKYRLSQQYQKTKYRFSLIVSSFSFILLLGMLLFDGFAWLDGFVRAMTGSPVMMTILFFAILGFAADLLGMPFSIYSTFVIEEKFGFNKTTAKTFILDKIKGWLLAAIIGGGLLALVVVIYEKTGPYFWLLGWGVVTLISLFFSMFYSDLIVPLFNKQTPLQQGELRDAIEDFAATAGFRLKNIYVIDGSKRSKKSNAYFSGLGPKKRIVLYDTLIENHTVQELVTILAHEIGHYKKKHTLSGLVLSVIQTGAIFYLLGLFISRPELSIALGSEQASFHMGVLAFGILFSPINTLLGIGINIFSRRNEYQADRFAGEKYNPDSLRTALIKLSRDNLSNLTPHPAYVFVHYSHPPLLKRLAALDAIKAEE